MILWVTYFGRAVIAIFFLLMIIGVPQRVFAAEDGVHLISAKLPGGLLEYVDEKLVGAYATYFHEASVRSGVQIDFRIVPWARAVRETERSDNLLLFPLTRTPKREARFIWITPLTENLMCFSSVGAPVNSLDEARKLKRVITWLGTSHQEFLEKNKFKNLIVVKTKLKILEILKSAPDAALYWVCNEIQSFLDADKSEITVKIGAPVSGEDIWLASGKSFVRNAQTDKFVKALVALKEKDLLTRLLNETMR